MAEKREMMMYAIEASPTPELLTLFCSVNINLWIMHKEWLYSMLSIIPSSRGLGNMFELWKALILNVQNATKMPNFLAFFPLLCSTYPCLSQVTVSCCLTLLSLWPFCEQLNQFCYLLYAEPPSHLGRTLLLSHVTQGKSQHELLTARHDLFQLLNVGGIMLHLCSFLFL